MLLIGRALHIASAFLITTLTDITFFPHQIPKRPLNQELYMCKVWTMAPYLLQRLSQNSVRQ